MFLTFHGRAGLQLLIGEDFSQWIDQKNLISNNDLSLVFGIVPKL